MKEYTCCRCSRKFLSKANNAKRCKRVWCQRARSRDYRRQLRLLDRESDNKKILQWRKSSRIKCLLSSLRARAKRLGLEFSLTEKDIKIPKRCPVLGILLEWGEGFAKDSSPSVDRIDTSLGYTPDNIMVISHRANRIKSDAQPHEIQAIWRYVMKHYKPNTKSEEAGIK